MVQIVCAGLLSALFLIVPFKSFAATGILEIHSEPSGARIFINDVETGTTPYQNLEAPAGKHKVKVFFSPEYPPQVQEVLIDERSPQVIMFRFLQRNKGTFTGQEIVSTTWKHKGSVTFASVPTGAFVQINGERFKKPTPIGYTDLEVGRYTVEFLLEGRTLRADFDVNQEKTVKLVADFSAGKVINMSDQPKMQQDAAERNDLAPAKPQQKEEQLVAAGPEVVAPLKPVQQAPSAMQVSTRSVPQAQEGIQPYGELVITINVRRDANVKYSDIFEMSFQKLPIELLRGPLFPAASTIDKPVFKDKFDYMNDAGTNLRHFTAMIQFGSGDTAAAQDQAKSSVMTVGEGKYDLKMTMRRMVSSFYSVQRVFDETAQEAIEIVRGNRLIVQIDSHMSAENKLRYEIKRTYEDMRKKKSSAKKDAAKETKE